MLDIDSILWAYLVGDLDLVFPLPPRLPSFAAETIRPGAR